MLVGRKRQLVPKLFFLFQAGEVEKLYGICDPFFAKVIELYKVEKIVAVGKFCETRALKVAHKYLLAKSVEVGTHNQLLVLIIVFV